MLHLEDFSPGQSFELGSHVFSKDEIVAFATQYDPQAFHLTDDAAGPYGGLIASGWHTGSVYMRLLVDGLLARCASLGSPGIDKMRWLAPVRPGDTLTAKLIVEEVRPSKSRPDRGIVFARAEVTNQDGDMVFGLHAPFMIRRRENG
ncbi:MAG: dehydratase [Alphaproteobacteria bacterium]|nr:dehydratase [Alphaproteobacteria bacterium]